MATELQAARVTVKLDTDAALRDLDKLDAAQKKRGAQSGGGGSAFVAPGLTSVPGLAPGAAPGPAPVPSPEFTQGGADDVTDGREGTPSSRRGGSRPPAPGRTNSTTLVDTVRQIVSAGSNPIGAATSYLATAARDKAAQVLGTVAETGAGTTAGTAGAATAGAGAAASMAGPLAIGAAGVLAGKAILDSNIAERLGAFAGGFTGSSAYGDLVTRAIDPLGAASAYRNIRDVFSTVGSAAEQTQALAESYVLLGSGLNLNTIGQDFNVYLRYFHRMNVERRELDAFKQRVVANAFGSAISDALAESLMAGGR